MLDRRSTSYVGRDGLATSSETTIVTKPLRRLPALRGYHHRSTTVHTATEHDMSGVVILIVDVR
jgi:hypothetical protein